MILEDDRNPRSERGQPVPLAGADRGDLAPAEKMKELLVFSVSEQYFGLRKTLGIAVG